MHIKSLIVVFLCFFYHNIFAAENLNNDDYLGTWHSDITSIAGEKQTLDFLSDQEVIFSRLFSNGNEQKFKAKEIQYLDDLVLIEFLKDENSLAYKLVLSGWKVKSTMKLYGTMFMYRNNIQYNGLPISFIKSR